ncbi:GNAT family N-acetyltransferase [Actibacterium lipolyticum]|uniref:Putative N-acetyltransferase YjcF n=1 Tax=Actibacterium lipolyticum TaxID=1524263 RepID=A0A238KUW0_9RHOB|nr:GNAT family N-acetyltransferase [Actibacterium lipolyticum]SMX46634.1 putative N-acetyltransferase YjcF [Actibacterium lipolyticum]
MTYSIAITDDVQACVALRIAVFVDEQKVPMEDEIDTLDGEAVHILATHDGKPVGTARLLQEGAAGRIGRVCILADHRGTGLGAQLMTYAIDALRARGGLTSIQLAAQSYATGFYQRFGFEVIGPDYDDGGIPHCKMELRL